MIAELIRDIKKIELSHVDSTHRSVLFPEPASTQSINENGTLAVERTYFCQKPTRATHFPSNV